MIASIALLIYQHIFYSGTLDNVMPWKPWFCWVGVSVIETIAYLVFLYKFDDKGRKEK